jgi:hypothetical protein
MKKKKFPLPWRRSIDPITDPNLNGERMYSAKKKIQFEKKSQPEKRKGEKNFFGLENKRGRDKEKIGLKKETEKEKERKNKKKNSKEKEKKKRKKNLGNEKG